MPQRIYTTFLIAGTVCVLGYSTPLCAAELSFEHGYVRVNDEFEVRLVLNSSDAAINAIEGIFTFPAHLEVKEIRDGNSSVVFWVERPHVTAGAIRFSGIMPDGLSQQDATLFSTVFTARQTGEGLFNVHGGRAFLNDGEGTAAKLSISPSNVTVVEDGPTENAQVATLDDREPPESFKPEIAQSENILNNEYFVVFATQDKRSGIDSYAVHESRWNIFWVPESSWREAESPYLLQDQSLRSIVYVRAVDKAGNVRTEMLSPTNGILGQLWIFLVLLVVIFFGGILALKYRRHTFGGTMRKKL